MLILCYCTSKYDNSLNSLCAYIYPPSGLDIYSGSDHLPRYLNDPSKGPSYDVSITPWQDALNTHKSRWDWLEEEVRVDALQAGNNSSSGGSSGYPGVFGTELQQACEGLSATTLIKRPEHRIFGLAMVGGGRVFGQAHLHGKSQTD